jgi:hypothetical protein
MGKLMHTPHSAVSDWRQNGHLQRASRRLSDVARQAAPRGAAHACECRNVDATRDAAVRPRGPDVSTRRLLRAPAGIDACHARAGRIDYADARTRMTQPPARVVPGTRMGMRIRQPDDVCGSTYSIGTIQLRARCAYSCASPGSVHAASIARPMRSGVRDDMANPEVPPHSLVRRLR